MNKFWSDIVAELDPYVPGEQPKLDNLIKLNTNENPYPPAPSVGYALSHMDAKSLRLYPDPNSDALKQTLAEYYQVEPEQIFVGNGSDEVLAHCFQALLKHRKPLLMPDISYSFYPVYCGLYGVEYQTVALDHNLCVNLDDYATDNGGVIFPNPNAPTGVAISRAKIEAFLQRNTESVVVVDEAYVDFGAESAVPLVAKYANLMVVQTASKSRSLAGLRIGYAIADAGLIEALERVKNSFNSYPVDRVAQLLTAESFRDELYFQRCRDKIMASRQQLVVSLSELGFAVLPSSANFVFASHPKVDAAQLQQGLRARSIIVRYFNKPRIDQYLRITVGTPDECAALVKALTELLV